MDNEADHHFCRNSHRCRRHRLILSAKDMFSPVSVCLSVCLSVNRIAQKLLNKSLRIFMEWLDIIQGPIDCILSDLDLRSSLKVKRSKSFLRIIPFKIITESRDKD